MRTLRILFRRFLRAPGFTGLSLFTLAVGIGATTAIFSVVWGVVLRPLPYEEPGRLVGLLNEAPGLDLPDELPHTEESFVLIRDRARSFESVALLDEDAVTLTGEGQARRIEAARVTASAFRVLRARPLHGRLFDEEDEVPGGSPVVILAHGLWLQEFGGDPSVVGRSVELSGESHEVVGVMPEDFRDIFGGSRLWRPYRIDEAELPRVSFSFPVVARLAPGATVESASAELDALMATLPDAYPDGVTHTMMEEAGWSSYAMPLDEQITGDVASTLWILLGAVGLVLLIACANVANLFVVRAEGRRQELAVRSAMGAGRGDRLRESLAESLALASIAGALALVLAWLGVESLLALTPTELPRAEGIGVNGPVVIFTAAVSLAAGLAFGLLSLVRHRGDELVGALKEGGRGGSAGRETHRLRNGLVAGQVALAVILLVGSGLLLRSFDQLRRVDPGFATGGVLTFRVSLPDASYDGEAAERFWRELDRRLAALPGVRSVGSADYLPLSPGQSNNAMIAEDDPPEPGSLPEVIRTVGVGPGYFETMDIPVLRGRAVTPDDLGEGREVAVVSRSLAERIWGGGDAALGRRISQDFTTDGTVDSWMPVVGIVEDVHDTGLDVEPDEMVYVSRSVVDAEGERRTDGSMTFVVATRDDPAALAPAVRDAVWALDPGLPVMSVRTTGEIVREGRARTTFAMALIGVAAWMALLLGVVGLYGVIAYLVRQRTREIGVRMALGAEGGRIRAMVVRQGMAVAAVGVVLGLVGAFGVTRLLDAMLYGVEATDPATFVVTPLLLLLVSLGASWLPALRASRLDPAAVLRAE